MKKIVTCFLTWLLVMQLFSLPGEAMQFQEKQIPVYDAFAEKFDEISLMFDDKEVIHITIANGNEKPYYLKSKGMTYEGCFIRIGSSVEHMHQNEIDNLLSVKLKPSLKRIVSPKQKLTFSQLKIYYEEMGYPINNNFLEQLNLKTEDGRFNYLAYLLADNNEISIKVATYSTTDSYDLIESEEYGYFLACCGSSIG